MSESENVKEEEMEVGMVRQTLEAAKQSDLVLLMFDLLMCQ